MKQSSDLHDYQREAIDWMINRERGFVWLGMGDGKTVIAATALLGKSTSPDARALIVGTKRIVEHVWPTELKKWSHLSSLSYSAAVGTKRRREKAVSEKSDILGVSYENLKWAIESGSVNDRQFWIFDEVSKMKASSTGRFKALMKSKHRPEKCFGLTATPSTEGHMGLWSQWASVGGDKRIGRNITEFRHLFCRQKFRGQYSDYTIDEAAERRIESLLSDSIFTIADDRRPYIGHPLIEDVVIPWAATGSRDHYKRMEKQLIADLGSMRFAVASKAASWMKCRQLATGFIYDEEHTAHEVDQGKFDAIVEAYEELQGEPVLVFYQFEHERDTLLERLPGSQVLLGDNYAAFNRGEIPALILHPRSCSHGLNLQGGRYAFWSSLTPSGEEYMQANGRIDRQGQRRQPIIKRFLREGTVDFLVRDLAEGKVMSNEMLIERIRGIE